MTVSPARPHVLCAALSAALLAAACESSPPPPEPTPEPPARFEAERALEHVRALAEGGPRGPGGAGAEAARAYIREVLAEHGIALRGREDEAAADGEAEPARVRNLVARIPPVEEEGSEDLFLLAAPYDADELEEAGDGASGAALLLELARVLAERPLPYTVRLAFLQGESPRSRDELPSFAGSRALADALEEEGAMRRLRLLLYAVDVCPPEIRVIRDLFSSRVYRRRVFDAGAALGFEEAFPADAPFEEAAAGHRVFFQRGFRRGIALSASGTIASGEGDAASEGAEPSAGSTSGPAPAEGGAPPALEPSAEDESAESQARAAAEGEGGESPPAAEGAEAGADAAAGPAGCDPQSFAAVGATAEHALRDIAALLRKVDRFATRPEPEEPREPESGGPVPDEGAETPEESAPPPPVEAGPAPGLPQPGDESLPQAGELD